MIMVTAAFPFVPANLNIAHFASTYVPADIYTRALNCLGEKAVLVSATDYHSIYASSNGKEIDIERCNCFHARYMEMFKTLGIQFDQYMTTEDPDHKSNVIRAYQTLRAKGLVYTEASTDYVCIGCACHLPKRLLGDDERCPFCRSKDISMVSVDHERLRLNNQLNFLKDYVAQVNQPEVGRILFSSLEKGIKDWEFTRVNHLGVSVPGSEGKSFYIWFDSLIGYDSLAKRSGNIERTVHFIGKNIIYYHGIVWPFLYQQACNRNYKAQISARGFLLLEQTSQEMLDVKQLAQQFHPDMIRFYLCFKTQDNTKDYYFTFADFRRVVGFYCCKLLGGFFFRAWSVLRRSGPTSGDALPSVFTSIRGSSEDLIQGWKCNIEEMQLQLALKRLLNWVETLDGILRRLDSKIILSYTDRTFLARESAMVVCLLSVIMPNMAFQYSIFDNWVPRDCKDVENYVHHQLKKTKEFVRFYER